MKFRFSFAATWLASVWLGTIAPPCQAQNLMGLGGSDGISVFGTGELSARPNKVEVDLNVSGKAELTGDAIVKFRDAKKRALEALEKLKLPGLSTEELALTISAGNSSLEQQRMMNGQAPTATKTQIDVSCVLRAVLKDVRNMPAEELIRTVGKLIDTAQDSGVTIGPSAAEVMRQARYGNYTTASSPVRFVVSDLAELREKAYEAAVADARSRAARLAKLNHLKLGSAISVQEILVAGDLPAAVNANAYANPQMAQPSPDSEQEEPKIASSSLSGMRIQVKLLVRFAIAAADPATAQQ